VTAECIHNCWKHTGILDETLAALPEDPIHEEVNQQIQQLRLDNPMDIHRFLNPMEEDHHHHPLLSDEELIEISESVDHDLGQDIAEADEQPAIQSFKQRHDTLRWAIRSLEASGGYDDVIQGLRKHIREVTDAHRILNAHAAQQLEITNFFAA
jgi:hypothetical protein